MSQPKIKPVLLPCALRESGLPETTASLSATNEPEVVLEEHERHGAFIPLLSWYYFLADFLPLPFVHVSRSLSAYRRY
jgi:hypothetical protein